MKTTIKAVIIGLLITFAGTVPRNLVFLANLHYVNRIPWAVVFVGIYLYFFWRYLDGWGEPQHTSAYRKMSLRAVKITATQWGWSLCAGISGIIALVILLRVFNRLVMLPPQTLPDLSAIPRFTVYSLLLAAAPIAGIIEEAAFRGYMQGPIERRYGITIAILITGTMFALSHLDFTLILWPYYVAVAAIYGLVTYLTSSILPAIVLHTLGNTYSNLDLLLYGHAEWQAARQPAELIWSTGADMAFWQSVIAFMLMTAISIIAYLKLSRLAIKR